MITNQNIQNILYILLEIILSNQSWFKFYLPNLSKSGCVKIAFLKNYQLRRSCLWQWRHFAISYDLLSSNEKWFEKRILVFSVSLKWGNTSRIEVGMECRNYLLKEVYRNSFPIPEVNAWFFLLREVAIHPQFQKAIPDFSY